MRKIFLFCLIMLMTKPALAAFGWSDRQAAIWTRERTSNTALWQDIKRRADGAQNEDLGEYDALVCLTTSDNSYCQRAFNHVKWLSTYNPDRNYTRDKFLRIAKLFGQIKDRIPAADKATFRAILDKWCDLVFQDPSVAGNHGTRTNDSDEMSGHYFGVGTYAVAIADEDPARSKQLLDRIGGLTATAVNTSTWRNTIARYATLFKGGVWMESSGYNYNSASYVADGVYTINEVTGKDNFPEYTAIWKDWAKAIVSSLTPDFKKSFQWGDEQNPRYIKYYSALQAIMLASFLSDSQEAYYVADKWLAFNGTTSVVPRWALFVDPTKPRKAPAGRSCHNAPGMGITLCRTGWTDSDYFIAIITKPWTGVDHQSNAFQNFVIFKGNKDVLTYPIGYGSYEFEQLYSNGFQVNGGLPLIDQEFKGQIDFKDGGDYVYHAGRAQGKNVKKSDAETIQEYTRQFIHYKGVTVTFDRVNTPSLPTLSKYNSNVQKMMNKTDRKHVYILHTPVDAVRSGSSYEWPTASGDIMKVTPYWEHDAVMQADQNEWGSFKAGEKNRELRLITKSGTGFQTLLTVLNPTGLSVQRVTSAGRDGVNIEGKIFQFNSDQNSTPNLFVDNGPVIEPDPQPEPPDPEPEPDPIPTPEPDPVECPECVQEPILCPTCEICKPFVSPTIYIASQVGSLKSAMYEKMNAGEIIRYYHSTHKRTYRCQAEQ